MNFKFTASGVQRLTDGAFIPNDQGNLDWLAYQVWLAQGNAPLQADPPPAPVAKTLNNGDMQALLLKNGTITQAQVDAALAPAVTVK